MGNALVPIPEAELQAMSAEEREQFLAFYNFEMQQAKEGITIHPSVIKISKDTMQYVDALGNTMKELRGVIVYKHKARGYWVRGQDGNVPCCSSIDAITGVETETNKVVACVNCPHNEWGSGIDEAGNPTRGKACKEMRRVFIVSEGAALPSVLTLPPTSITDFDKHMSARVSQGVADIAKEVIFKLTPETASKFKYAKVVCEMGAAVPPREMMRLAKMRQDVAAAAERMGVTEDDYDTSDVPTVDGIVDETVPF